MILQDVRYAARLLVQSRSFTAIAILSLALGIGANTAVFSLINAVLLKPLPVEDPASLVVVSTTDERNPGTLPLSHLNFKDLRAENEVLSGMVAVSGAGVNYSTGGEAEQVFVEIVTSTYFSVLGVQPVLGRGFLPEEEDRATPVAVISQGFWDRSLGSDRQIVGKTVTFNRTPFTIVGVAPKGFTGTALGPGPAAWVPMSMHLVVQPGFEWYEQRRGLFLASVGRLKPGVTVAQARANLKTIFSRLEAAYPDDNKGRSATAVPIAEARLNPGGQGPALVVQVSAILMGVVGIVLLVACANIANLLLARAAKRRREVAVRLALGAGRARLIRQFLTESVLVAIAGGLTGLLVAYWALDGLAALRLPLPLPVNMSLALDPRVLVFTGLLAVTTGILFGLAPALQASKVDVVTVLKEEGVPVSAGGRRGLLGYLSLRRVLVVLQVALSLVALVAAGLFLRSLQMQWRIDPGFQTSGVLMVTFNLGRDGYTPERGQLFYREVVERTSALPGVRAAAVAQNPPLGGGLLRSVFPEGVDTTTRDRILVQVNSVGAGYFDAIGIPVIHGRAISREDTAQSPKVVVVNETMAARFWPKEEALGKRFKFFGDPDYATVVGVARDAKYNAVAEDPTPYIYEAITQRYQPAVALHVRAVAEAAGLAPAVRHAVQQIDPALSMFNVRTLEEQVSQSLQPLRMYVVMLAIFGGLALLLASIGVYGVASYAVSQRTREIGVRMAIGAQTSNVVALVLRNGLALVAAGLLVGLTIALLVAGAMRALLVGVNPRDPLTFVATAAVLAVVAFVASYLPARRAARIDPLIALRTE